MHEDGFHTVKSVLSFVSISPDLRVLRQAIEASSFNRLQRIEIKKGIAGHRYDANDPNARRGREGKVGGYLKHLGGSDLEYIAAKCEDECTVAAKQLLSQHGIEVYPPKANL